MCVTAASLSERLRATMKATSGTGRAERLAILVVRSLGVVCCESMYLLTGILFGWIFATSNQSQSVRKTNRR
jgi:hypothetical protein